MGTKLKIASGKTQMYGNPSLEFSTPFRATHGDKVEGEKQTKSNLTNAAK